MSRSDGNALTYTYDGFLRTSAVLSGTVNASVTWAYDNFFRVTQRTVNGGTPVVYSYDNDNLYLGTSSPLFSVTRDYTNGGRIASTTLGSVSDVLSYDGFSELTSYAAASGSTAQYQLTVASRDLNGRITEMTELINGVTHNWSSAYDSRGRLTSATRDLVTNTYAYDPNGNRRTMNGGGEWFYDSQDRLLSSADGSSFTYRNDGTAMSKTTSVGTYAYAYDLGGFLESVALPSGNSVQYAADARNRRIARSLVSGSNTISQQFVYDNQLRVAAELGNNGATVTSVFVYGTKLNVPDYMIQGGATYRIISDWLGSVRLVVNASSGAIVQQLDYDEFGNVLSSSFDTTCASTAQCFPFQPFGFAGGLQDRDTGLVRFGARDYDPQVGRWVSKDPILFAGGDTDIYVYVGNDPINAIDPNGLQGPAMLYLEQWWQQFVNLHLNRNEFNICPATAPSEDSPDSTCGGRTWSRDWWDDKWRASDGSECAYDSSGNLLPDQNANYTYNFGPDPWTLTHIAEDFLPHFIIGGNYTPGLTTVIPAPPSGP